ncbi:MAG TPA: Hpt domain-containing protein, partial [Pseudomonadota bacterium]|nr:Hpt domain-containing protein [Pseudomonadota bacterium]
DESSADEVLALARVDWPKALHAAEASMRALDLDALGREAHYLAGSALQVGASGLGRLCREIEQAVRRNDATQARQLLATVAQRVFDLLTSL